MCWIGNQTGAGGPEPNHASVAIQRWYHDIPYRRLELEPELLLLERLENYRLDVNKHLADNKHNAMLELQERLELEHECFLLDQLYLEEQVAYFQQDYFPTQIDLVNQPPLITLEEAQTLSPFNSTEAKSGFMVIKQQQIDFATAESSLTFLHGQQSYAMIAMGLPFHMSLEIVPYPSI